MNINMILKNLITLLVCVLITSPLLLSVVNGWHLFAFTSLMLVSLSVNPSIMFMHFTTKSLILILTAIFSALLTWFVEYLRYSQWGETEPYFIYSFSLTFIIGVSGFFIDQLTSKHLPVLRFFILISVLLFIFSVSITALKLIIPAHGIVILDSPVVLGASIGFCAGTFLCMSVFKLILPSLKLFKYLAEYLYILVLPAAAFFIGYIIVIILFAGIYAYLDTLETQFAIAKGSQYSFANYLYYSFTAITSVGYSSITPASGLIKWLTVLQEIISIIWMTVVLAATLGFVQEKFGAISKKHKNVMPDDK